MPTQQDLDGLKLALAKETGRRFSGDQIRVKILKNLERWKARGVWVSAYDEWQAIAESGDDAILRGAMIGENEYASRLRNSMAFVGLLPAEVVRRLKGRANR